MRPERHGDGTIRAANSASYQCGHQEIAAAATILFGNGNSCVALLRETFPDPCGEIVCAFDFGIMWSNLVSREVKCAFVGELMLFREFKVHKLEVLSNGSCQCIYIIAEMDCPGRKLKPHFTSPT